MPTVPPRHSTAESTTVLVSVIIPTHNRAHLLENAIKSVTQQTYHNIELIVVDDGSEDQTGDLICQYPSIRYLRQTHQGVSAARNHGMRLARGQWYAFLDSDDCWLPTKLEKQMKQLAYTPELLVCHTNEIWIRSGRRVNQMQKHTKRGGDIFMQSLQLCSMSPSSIVLHKSIIDDIGHFDETMPACEDYDLWLRLAARYEVSFVDEPLVIKYGGHADQLSKHYWGMDRWRIETLEKLLAIPDLSHQRRQAVIDVIRKKINVYLNGARKRHKTDEVHCYTKKLLKIEQDQP